MVIVSYRRKACCGIITPPNFRSSYGCNIDLTAIRVKPLARPDLQSGRKRNSVSDANPHPPRLQIGGEPAKRMSKSRNISPKLSPLAEG